uniref:Uncharacterized protein n=1 Tax=Anguilla anguilla TaxID=7936 RepID=A0A0E9VV92_ANGAN
MYCLFPFTCMSPDLSISFPPLQSTISSSDVLRTIVSPMLLRFKWSVFSRVSLT